jgi:hypothetical protein
VSVAPGGVLHLHVSAAAGNRYRVEIYRLGWYGGLGGRLITCLPSCGTDRAGVSQPSAPPPDPLTGMVDAGWTVTDTVNTGSNWVSGYYLAELHLTTGPDKGGAGQVPFIVRAAPGDSSSILVQVPVNTWQAYNGWGGESLYHYNSTVNYAANHVSFNRPYELPLMMFTYDYQLARFLEREGYATAYTTDTDVDIDPAQLLQHRLVIVSGHSEYWSKTMRDGFESARDAGVNLAFLGGNDVYWQIRYGAGDRTIVEYRSSAADPDPNPATKTDLFRRLNPPRPECQLLGVWYLQANGQGAYTFTGADPYGWLGGTGLIAGNLLSGVAGGEGDTYDPRCGGPQVTTLFHYNGTPAGKDAVVYAAPSGARVFSASSEQFDWGMDDWGHPGYASPLLQKYMTNLLNDLAGPAPPHASLNILPPAQAPLRSPHPQVSDLHVTLYVGRPGSHRRRMTLAYRFALSSSAGVTLSLEREMSGRRAGQKCVSSRTRGARGRRCVRWIRVVRFSIEGFAGRNHGQRSMRQTPARHLRAVAVASDSESRSAYSRVVISHR